MRTVHCVRAVATALGAVDGIMTAQVRLGEAELEHLMPLDRGALAQAIETAGYSLREVVLSRALPVHHGDEGGDSAAPRPPQPKG